MTAPRIQSLGHGIRVDHRSTCRTDHPRCGCPMSWHERQANGARKRRTGFVGTLTQARDEKHRASAEAREQTDRSELDEASETVTAYFARWMRRGEPKWSPATVEVRDRAYRRYLVHVGHVPIRDITPRVIEDWIDKQLGGGNGHRAVEQAFVTLRAMLGTAAKRRVIDWNPALAVEFPERPTSDDERDHLTMAEYGELLAACTRLGDEVMVRLAAEVAMRRGELCALRWSDLDLDTRLVTVRATVVRTTGAQLVLKAPKGNGHRVAALSAATVEKLMAYRAELVEAEAYDDDGHVFPSGRNGRVWSKPLDPMTFTHRCARLMKTAKLTNEKGGPAFSLHDLRRSAATFARERGVAEDVIRDQLGHSTTAVTRGHYIRTQSNPNIADFAAAFDDLS